MTELTPPAALDVEVTLPEALRDVEAVRSVRTPIRLDYDHVPGEAAQKYLRNFESKRIVGRMSPVDGAVFVPPRGVDPRHGVATPEEVEVADRGHVGSFSITRVPIPGRDDLEVPYTSAWIFLDGSDIGFLGLVGEIDPAEVRIGMRVEAVWVDDADLGATAENVRYWRPTGEEDVPFEQAGERGWDNGRRSPVATEFSA